MSLNDYLPILSFNLLVLCFLFFFFFNDTATTEIYTLSLHDALPISERATVGGDDEVASRAERREPRVRATEVADRKSTRLNSSHSQISYAVFCLKKKKKKTKVRQSHETTRESEHCVTCARRPDVSRD